ncbi:MAG: hypothetical protein ACTTI3_03035 [Treponema sp.]
MNLASIIRNYAIRINTPTVSMSELTDYIQKYAQRNVQEHPDLRDFVDIAPKKLLKMFEDLGATGVIEIVADKKKGAMIFIPQYYIDMIIRLYDTIKENPERTFPLTNEVPLNFPSSLIRTVRINTHFTTLEPEQGKQSSFLYQLLFPDETPALIFPSTFSTDTMLEFACAKLRVLLRRSGQREFFQNRLLAANPGKDFSVRNFIATIQDTPTETIRTLKNSGETYLLWHSLCGAIKSEMDKKPEKMLDEIAIMQSLYIIEYMNNFYRNKSQQDLQRETALKNLEGSFLKQPYYFTKATIVNFKDSRGISLFGQYSEKDFEDFMQQKTTAAEGQALAEILSFKTLDGERYYILFEKVIPLLIALIQDSRKKIRDRCVKIWYHQLLQFERMEAMHSDKTFDALLSKLCEEQSPVLYGLLNAAFLPVVVKDPTATKKYTADIQRIFPDGNLRSYSALFSLNRQELFTDTRMLLPFWCTIPVISPIISFFVHSFGQSSVKGKTKRKAKKQRTAEEPKQQPAAVAKKPSAHDIAEELYTTMVPTGKTIAQCLAEQLDAWNTNIDPAGQKQNTESVNAFIKDYLRMHKPYAATLNAETIQTIAETIANAPNLAEVKYKNALRRYIEYYILQVLLRS